MTRLRTKLGQALLRYAAQVGCPIKLGKWPGDGSALQADDPEMLAHEIAHWLVATPLERTKPWLGIGEPPGNGGPNPPHKEAMANLLGVMILCELKAPVFMAGASSRHIDYSEEDDIVTIAGLKRRNLWSEDRDRLTRALRRRFPSSISKRDNILEEMARVGNDDWWAAEMYVKSISRARSKVIDYMYGLV